MVYLLIVLCLFFILVGLRCSHNNIFAPSVMTGFIWLMSLSLYLILGQQIAELSTNVYICLLFWIAGTSFSSLYAQSATFRDSQLDEPGLLIRNIYLLASVLYVPKLYFFAKAALMGGTSGNWAWDLRLAAIGQGSGFDEPFGGIFVVIWQVSFLMELLCFKKKNAWRVVLIALIYLAFGTVTMAKIIFLNFFLFSCSILYFKKVIKMKHLVTGLAVLFVLFVTLQSIRNAVKPTDVKDNYLVLYIVSNLTAFDSLEPCSAAHFGENTFRICYAFAESMGWSDIEPIDTLLRWVEKPIPTNTYTAMYPFYIDFGIWGVIIFPLFLGWVYGWLFKKAQSGSNFHILLYAVVANIICMQYAAELFFTNLAGNIKIFCLLVLPFLVSKHNLLMIRKRIINR